GYKENIKNITQIFLPTFHSKVGGKGLSDNQQNGHNNRKERTEQAWPVNVNDIGLFLYLARIDIDLGRHLMSEEQCGSQGNPGGYQSQAHHDAQVGVEDTCGKIGRASCREREVNKEISLTMKKITGLRIVLP